MSQFKVYLSYCFASSWKKYSQFRAEMFDGIKAGYPSHLGQELLLPASKRKLCIVYLAGRKYRSILPLRDGFVLIVSMTTAVYMYFCLFAMFGWQWSVQFRCTTKMKSKQMHIVDVCAVSQTTQCVELEVLNL